MNIRFASFLFFCVSMVFPLKAQLEVSGDKVFFGGVNINYGDIWAHTPSIQYVEGQSLNLQARWYRELNDDEDWTSPFRHPITGLALHYISTNTTLLEDGYGATLFIEPRILDSEKFSIKTRIHGGLAYRTTKYHKEDNPLNLLISTDLSFMFELKMLIDYKFSEHFGLGVNYSFTHFSNGAVKQPNLGLNIPTYGFNINYYPESEWFRKSPKRNVDFNRKVRFGIALGTGTRHFLEDTDKYSQLLSMDLHALKRFSPWYALEIDLKVLHRQGSIEEKDVYSTDYHQFVGASLGNEFRFKNLAMLIQYGYYFYNSRDFDGAFYGRNGARYYFSDHFFTSVTMVNHGKTADYVNFSVGFFL